MPSGAAPHVLAPLTPQDACFGGGAAPPRWVSVRCRQCGALLGLTWASKSRESGGRLSRNRVTGVSRCSSSTTVQSGENLAITFTLASAGGEQRGAERSRNGGRAPHRTTREMAAAPHRSAPHAKWRPARPGPHRTTREMAPTRSPLVSPFPTHGGGPGALA